MADDKLRLPSEAALTGNYVRTASKALTGGTVHEHIFLVGGLASKMASAVTANVHYIGEAIPGTASATSAWRISRLDETSGGEPIVLWANGTDEMIYDWNSRATFTYS